MKTLATITHTNQFFNVNQKEVTLANFLAYLAWNEIAKIVIIGNTIRHSNSLTLKWKQRYQIHMKGHCYESNGCEIKKCSVGMKLKLPLGLENCSNPFAKWQTHCKNILKNETYLIRSKIEYWQIAFYFECSKTFASEKLAQLIKIDDRWYFCENICLHSIWFKQFSFLSMLHFLIFSNFYFLDPFIYYVAYFNKFLSRVRMLHIITSLFCYK